MGQWITANPWQAAIVAVAAIAAWAYVVGR